MGGEALGAVLFEQPQPGQGPLVVGPQGHLPLAAVHSQGANGAPLGEKGFPQEVKGFQGLALGVVHRQAPGRQQRHRAVHHNGAGLGLGLGLRPVQDHRAPNQPEDTARLPPQGADLHEAVAVHGEDSALSQLDLGQAGHSRGEQANLAPLRLEQGKAELLEGHLPRAIQPEGRPLLAWN